MEHRHGLRGLRARLREVRRDRDGARQGQEVGVPQAGQGGDIHSEDIAQREKRSQLIQFVVGRNAGVYLCSMDRTH